MNLTKFRHNLMRLVTSSDGEGTFYAMRDRMEGLSSPKTAKIINYAAKCCNPETESYVEIGSYTGFTLCAASFQNSVPCVGFDDLSMVDFCDESTRAKKQEEVRAKIQSNIASMKWNKNISFFEEDFRKVDLKYDGKDRTIGVFYIDGYHSYDQTIAAFNWGLPKLSDEAIIIVDDAHLLQVETAVLEQVFAGKFKLALFAANVPESNDLTLDEGISTGIAVLQFRRVQCG